MNLLLRFESNALFISPLSSSYHPPSFPPPDDWPVTFDRKGKPISLYQDDFWDFSPFGTSGFNFKAYNTSANNRMLFKQVMFFIIYNADIFPGKIGSCKHYFMFLGKIATFCDNNNITINELCRYPNLFPLLIEKLQSTVFYKAISLFHKLKLHESEIGFSIVNDKFLNLMARNAKTHEIVQHAYIPSRIWNYQISRLNEVLDDYILHKDKIAGAYEWLADAYNYNMNNSPKNIHSSFLMKKSHKKQSIIYHGSFDDFLRKWGIFDLITRWIEPNSSDSLEKYKMNVLTKYMNFVRDVSLVFILNFSIQRKNEALSLKSDCFYIEKDNYLGEICLIIGETTKTERDSDARWVVPKIVKKAVDASAWIAQLRLSSLSDSSLVLNEDLKNPFLMFPSMDPWIMNKYNIKRLFKNDNFCSRLKSFDYDQLVRRGLKLFDSKEIQISEEDAKIALSLTPNLYGKKWFGIGKSWHFSTHQLRRTLAVNMFASGCITVSSIQYQMKHFSRIMTLYYGRHYTNLRLNSGAESILVFECYNSVYQQLLDVVEDEMEFVRPHGKTPFSSTVVNLIDAGEEKKLMKLIRDGNTGVRKTLLGFCAKVGSCEYGGIESMSKCAGGRGGGICADAIFARKNEEKLKKLRDAHQIELEQLSSDSMRAQSIKQEIYAIEVYLNVIKSER